MIDVNLNSILSTAVGAGSVFFLARLYIQRAIKELDEVVKAMHEIKSELAIIAVKLEKIELNEDIVRKHDIKIAKLEARTPTHH